jgi:hypothetical protein
MVAVPQELLLPFRDSGNQGFEEEALIQNPTVGFCCLIGKSVSRFLGAVARCWSNVPKLCACLDPTPDRRRRRQVSALAARSSVDEYRTSKLWSQCHCRLEEARLRTKDKDGRPVLQESRNVLRGANSSCRANFWSRDVNAARNILEPLSSRPLEFKRILAFACSCPAVTATWAREIHNRPHGISE